MGRIKGITAVVLFGLALAGWATAVQAAPSFSGLELWLKADDGPQLTGNQVTGWLDKSPITSAHNAASVGTTNPILVPNVLGNNDMPVVRFNGGNWLTGSLPMQNDYSIFTYSESASASQRGSVFYTRGPMTSDFIAANEHNWSANSVVATYNRLGGQDVLRGPAAAGDFAMGSTVVAGNATSFYVNGSAGSSVENSRGTTASSGTLNYAVGTALNGDGTVASIGRLNGDVAEVLVYNRPLTTAERYGVENYLGVKYGGPIRAADVSLNDNHGSALGGALLNQGGPVGQRVQLDGSNDRIAIGDLGTHQQVSLAFWMNGDDLGNNSRWQGLVTSPEWEEGVMHVPVRNGKVDVWVNRGGTDRSNVTSSALLDDTWYHVALLADTTVANGLKLYVDGQLEDFDNISSLSDIKLLDQMIGYEGMESGTVGRFFDGQMADVRIYDRILGENEIKLLAGVTGGGGAPGEGMLGHWLWTPEPSTLTIWALGLACAALGRRGRRRKR